MVDIEQYIKKLQSFRELPLLLAIFLIGVSVVYISHGPRLADPDAWFQYMMAEYVVEEGGIPYIHELAYYPDGRTPWVQDNLFLPYLFAYTYMLVKPLGIEMMEWAMLFPAIFGGGFASVALYLAVNQLFDKKTGLLAALLYAFIPLNLTRVYAGTIDKEVIYGAFIFSAIALFLKSIKDGIELKKPESFLAPILGGMLLGISYANWSGASYTLLFIAVATVLFYIPNRRDLNPMKALLIITIISSITTHFIQPEKYPIQDYYNNYIVMISFFVSFLPLFSIQVSEYLNTAGRKTGAVQVFIITALVVVGGLTVAGEGDHVRAIALKPYNLLFSESGAQQDVYMATVAESQPSHFFGGGDTTLQRIKNGEFYPNLKLMLFVLPFALFLLLLKLKEDKKNYAYYFAIVWLVSGFLAANQGHRYLFFLAPSSVTVTAFIFMHFIGKSSINVRKFSAALKSPMKPKMKANAERKLSNAKTVHLAAVILTLLIAFATLDSATAMMSHRRSDLPPPWLDATMWMKENTPENSVIIFWWDYGYYFQSIAERYTVADGGANIPVNINLSYMFTSPEEDAMKIIEEFVNYTEVPTYMLVSYEEFGKSGAINWIAKGGGDNPDILLIGSQNIQSTGNQAQDEQAISKFLAQTGFTSYHIVNFESYYQIWFLVDNGKPEMKDKLLAKLLPFNTGHGQGLEHFELVYSKYGYIWIYKIK
jgi:dolichyl-diphosphooligosaccharide--protein glycosyltransferase